ncbi:DUF2971 domain-containing protein [Mongoliitalea lutea]|nr:DUF2971 domain-containing protein [Mongoliitalea lutea]
MEVSKTKNPRFNRKQHRDFAKEWAKNGPLTKKGYIEKTQKEHYEEFDKRFGVLSLTANHSNLSMWNKYSGSGKDFCVGFDSEVFFSKVGGGGPVFYVDELPVIYHSDDRNTEHIKQVFHKEKKWAFEEEYRTHKFYPNPASIKDRQIILPQICFKEVVFGWDIAQKSKDEIMEVCIKNNLNVDFKHATLNGNGIVIQQLNI